jgi:hypothetical protein
MWALGGPGVTHGEVKNALIPAEKKKPCLFQKAGSE